MADENTKTVGIGIGADNIYKLSNIATAGYEAIDAVGMARELIMREVKEAAAGGTNAKVHTAFTGVSRNTSTGVVSGTATGSAIDISTGAGALVLDDALQELSTLEQAAAQLVAAENKAQKQVHSVTGQG